MNLRLLNGDEGEPRPDRSNGVIPTLNEPLGDAKASFGEADPGEKKSWSVNASGNNVLADGGEGLSPIVDNQPKSPDHPTPTPSETKSLSVADNERGKETQEARVHDQIDRLFKKMDERAFTRIEEIVDKNQSLPSGEIGNSTLKRFVECGEKTLDRLSSEIAWYKYLIYAVKMAAVEADELQDTQILKKQAIAHGKHILGKISEISRDDREINVKAGADLAINVFEGNISECVSEGKVAKDRIDAVRRELERRGA